VNEVQASEPLGLRLRIAAAMETGQLSSALLLSENCELASAGLEKGIPVFDKAVIYCAIPTEKVRFIAKNHRWVEFGHGLIGSNLGFSLLVVATQMGDEQHRLLVPLVGPSIKLWLCRLFETKSPMLLMFGDELGDNAAQFKVRLGHSLEAALAVHQDTVDVPCASLKGELLQIGFTHLHTVANPPSIHVGKPFQMRVSVVVPPEYKTTPVVA
jgi:hypothetical protein